MKRLSVSDCHSEAQSCRGPVDSVDSVAIVPNRNRKPLRRLRRPRKREKSTREQVTGSKFLQFCVEMRDVPVNDVWAFVRDHKVMAKLIPGILASFDYLEGDGETGSLYVSRYNVKHTKPGEINFVMHRVEVRDDASHLHAVRSVEGRYRQRYQLFLSYLKVLPDEAFGDSSSLVIWRVEYQLENLSAPIPEDSMASHKFTMELFRDMHNRLNQVERPTFDHSEAGEVLKPWRLRGKRRQIGTANQLEARASAQCSPRKSRVVKHLIKNGGTSDGDDENISKRRSDTNCRTRVEATVEIKRSE